MIMGKLEGKVAAITGGTRSIGRAMADAFIREGASVVINGRDEAKGQAAVNEMGGPQGEYQARSIGANSPKNAERSNG